jgi:hypothetical protein
MAEKGFEVVGLRNCRMNRVIRRLSTLRGEYEVPIKVAG